MGEHLLKSDEVAEILQVSRSFAYLLMKRGEIPSVRIGNTVRVRPEDLERYIEMQVFQNDAVTRSSMHSAERKS